MSPEALNAALIDMGWLSVTHRALRGKPSSTYALRQLMRCAGRPVPFEALAREYELMMPGKDLSGSDNAIMKRVERARTALEDLGCPGVIRPVVGERAYLIEKRDVPRIEAALLFACGFELEPCNG